MTATERADDAAFQARMLDGVSRTFALTIPQLPAPLRPAIGNAYLLCRLADIIEDSAGLDPAGKRAHLHALVAALDHPGAGAAFSAGLQPAITDAPAAERELVAEAERVFRLYRSLPAEQRTPLQRCLTIMADGMARFADRKSPHGLPDLTAFREYCYYVAGVVGEMLTDLFALQVPAIADDQAAMRRRAVAFGLGLQMTNILKDVWDDRQRGVCWLPRDVFAHHGCDLAPDARWHESHGFQAGIRELTVMAHGHLREALRYTRGVPSSHRGIRRFCAWAIGMALYTLKAIHHRPDFDSARQVKLSRSRLRGVIVGCNLAVRNDRLLTGAFHWAARGLPAPPRHQPNPMASDEDTPWTRTR
ncbi:phytoene/squalene synthase family protein [Aquisalimonas asiatica]|uniref:Farnesyl-diphosphate farnesyltransferase n=1 Tax=Aquisalimonas asiatica TaxID=406100 RepID=A0A1H8TCT7_9GAMM|nr:phytoene/squalene synthase family protein [Aquisalimonas asiatica]SEO88910.1 farnesyl-diphosphate farnesyltransferase [Aquisalimonas asiatica]